MRGLGRGRRRLCSSVSSKVALESSPSTARDRPGYRVKPLVPGVHIVVVIFSIEVKIRVGGVSLNVYGSMWPVVVIRRGSDRRCSRVQYLVVRTVDGHAPVSTMSLGSCVLSVCLPLASLSG